MKKMLIRVTAVLLLAVMALTAVSCKKDDGTPDGMQNVAIPDATYDLFVPEGWLPQTSSGVSGARVSNVDTSNVTVTFYVPDTDLDAETYWKEHCVPAFTPAEGHVGLPAFAVVEEGTDTTLGGVNAKRYVFTFEMDGVKYKQMQIIAVEDSVVYTLQYHATEANYANHTDVVENDIRANFRFR